MSHLPPDAVHSETVPESEKAPSASSVGEQERVSRAPEHCHCRTSRAEPAVPGSHPLQPAVSSRSTATYRRRSHHSFTPRQGGVGVNRWPLTAPAATVQVRSTARKPAAHFNTAVPRPRRLRRRRPTPLRRGGAIVGPTDLQSV